MKRIFLLILAAVLFPVMLSARNPERVRLRDLDDGYWQRPNLIGVGLGAFTFNGNGTGFAPLTLSYDRKLKHDVTLGGMLHTASHFFSLSTDSYEVRDAVVLLGARVGYDLKVSRNVYFRFGLGAGIGFHYVFGLTSGCREYCGELPETPVLRTRANILADLHWVFRIGRNLELMVAPLILSPSQIIFSPWNDEYYYGFYNFSIAPIRLCVRF